MILRTIDDIDDRNLTTLANPLASQCDKTCQDFEDLLTYNSEGLETALNSVHGSESISYSDKPC
jgi:hypothetical protein